MLGPSRRSMQRNWPVSSSPMRTTSLARGRSAEMGSTTDEPRRRRSFSNPVCSIPNRPAHGRRTRLSTATFQLPTSVSWCSFWRTVSQNYSPRRRESGAPRALGTVQTCLLTATRLRRQRQSRRGGFEQSRPGRKPQRGHRPPS